MAILARQTSIVWVILVAADSFVKEAQNYLLSAKERKGNASSQWRQVQVNLHLTLLRVDPILIYIYLCRIGYTEKVFSVKHTFFAISVRVQIGTQSTTLHFSRTWIPRIRRY